MEGAAAHPARHVGLAVAAGGAIGAVLRFAISGWATAWAQAPFPVGTFAVNVVGSVALGVFTGTLARRGASPALRGFLTTGLCGGFTTFSAFEYETLALLQRGAHGTAALYALGSVAMCTLGFVAGHRLAAALPSRIR